MLFAPRVIHSLLRKKPEIPPELVTATEQAMDKTVSDLFKSTDFDWLRIRTANQGLDIYALYSRVRTYAYDLVSRTQYGHATNFDGVGMKVHRRLLKDYFEEYTGQHTQAAERYFDLTHNALIKNLKPIEEIWQKTMQTNTAPPNHHR